MGVDIGTLTGHVEIEEEFASALESLAHKAEKFAEELEGGFGLIAAGALAATAAITATVGAIVGLAVKGSTILGIEDTFDRLAEAAGTTGDVLREDLTEGVKGTIGELQLMESTTRLLSSGIKLTGEDALVLGEAARAMGKATGKDASEGLEKLSNALLTGRTRGLAMSGIIIDLKTAQENYARSLGLVASELTAEQQLEAKRNAILEATRGYVERLGETQLSFKEKLMQGAVAIEEWTDRLAKSVASSPNVMRALDNITAAIQRAFGGDSESLFETIVGWINKFADAAAEYGPKIVAVLGSIKDWIVEIWDVVRDTWDAIPDWFKNIARDAVLTGGAVFLAAEGMKAIGGSDVLGTLSNLSQVFGTVLTTVNELRVAVDAAKISTAGLGTATTLTAFATTTAIGVLGSAIVLIGGIATATYAARQAWELYKESQDRAGAASRQATVDLQTIALASEMAGEKFTTLDEAVAYLSTHVKDQATGVVVLRSEWEKARSGQEAVTETQNVASAAVTAYNEKVDKLVESLRASIKDQDLSRDAFEKGGLAIAMSATGIDKYIPIIDKLVASNKMLTETEVRYYEVNTATRLNLLHQKEALLDVTGVTLGQIQALEAYGMSEAEIAVKLGTTVAALRMYKGELVSVSTLTKQLADLENKVNLTSADAAIAERNRNFKDAVDKLDKTSAKYQETYDLMDAIRRKSNDLEGSDWDNLKKKSITALNEMAETAMADYNRMIESGLGFSREVLDAQLDKVHKLQDEARGMGDEFVKAHDRAAKAAEDQKKKLEDLAAAAKKAHDEMMAMGGSQEVTSMNFESSLDSLITSGGWNPSGMGSNIDKNEASNMARQGYSFQEITDYFRDRKAGSNQPPPPPKGPRIPGFERGGMGDFGEGTLAILHGREAIVPLGGDTTSFGGTTIHNTFIVNGNGIEVARQAGDILVKQFSFTRQRPAA